MKFADVRIGLVQVVLQFLFVTKLLVKYQSFKERTELSDCEMLANYRAARVGNSAKAPCKLWDSNILNEFKNNPVVYVFEQW